MAPRFTPFRSTSCACCGLIFPLPASLSIAFGVSTINQSNPRTTTILSAINRSDLLQGASREQHPDRLQWFASQHRRSILGQSDPLVQELLLRGDSVGRRRFPGRRLGSDKLGAYLHSGRASEAPERGRTPLCRGRLQGTRQVCHQKLAPVPGLGAPRGGRSGRVQVSHRLSLEAARKLSHNTLCSR